MYSQINRDWGFDCEMIFGFVCFYNVKGIVGVDIEFVTVDIDDCLQRVHLNSSFFLTLVKPTQTR